MKVHTTYKVRAHLSKAGYQQIDHVLEICRGLYNAALGERRAAWKHSNKRITRYDQFRSQTDLRYNSTQLSSLAVAITRSPLRRLDSTFNAYFRRLKKGVSPGYPRFKPPQRYNAIEISGVGITAVKRGRWTMKGLPTFHLRNPNIPDTPPVSVTVLRRDRRIYLCLTYTEERQPLPQCTNAIGLDMGINTTLATSNGGRIQRKRPSAARRQRLYRSLTRSSKQSHNHEKKRRRLNRECERLAISKRQESHRITTDLVQRHGTLCIEELRISRMMRSTRGTLNNLGRGVSAKRGLNREIQNQAWAQIRTMLHYKAEWAGRNLVLVNPAYTSQDCSRCGTRNPGPTPDRVYHCRACGLALDRDENAAVNILRKGLLTLAAVGNGKPSADGPKGEWPQPHGVPVEPAPPSA